MRHAGLPWELGLAKVHSRLCAHDLRQSVRLRVDGGLSTAEDIVIAAALGAEEFGFGKLLLVAQGCVMARICEKNRCPTGIATHDPKFKAKYKGAPEHVVALLERLAEGVRRQLAAIGAASLAAVIGDTSRLELAPDQRDLVRDRRLQLATLLHGLGRGDGPRRPLFCTAVNDLNQRVLAAAQASLAGEEADREFAIASTDRAIPARLCGWLARRASDARRRAREAGGETPDYAPHLPPEGTFALRFRGAAGQGFGAFLVQGIDLHLEGEANDSVCKSMAGGRVVVVPDRDAQFTSSEQVILGNCALYGATGGVLLVDGRAGDRFAVRNSGARTVVEGAGLHACEYMTGGSVVILGEIEANAGAGMTGGELFLARAAAPQINAEYVEEVALDSAAASRLRALLEEHASATGSARARLLLADWATIRERIARFLPRRAQAKTSPHPQGTAA
jgi:glutamate synthase domain-containing protein 3